MHVLTLKCTSSPPHSSNPKCSALHLHFISTYGKTAARWSRPEDKSHNASRWSGRVHYVLHSVWTHLQWWTRRPAFWVFDHQTPWPGWTSDDDQPTRRLLVQSWAWVEFPSGSRPRSLASPHCHATCTWGYLGALNWPPVVVCLSMWSYNEIVTCPGFNPTLTQYNWQSAKEKSSEKRDRHGWLDGWVRCSLTHTIQSFQQYCWGEMNLGRIFMFLPGSWWLSTAGLLRFQIVFCQATIDSVTVSVDFLSVSFHCT